MMGLQVTPIAALLDIKRQQQGIVIALPPFLPGTEFNARVRRLMPVDLVAAGTIPNSLLSSVNNLFADNQQRKAKGEGINLADERLNDFTTLIECVCEAALAEPTVQELRENDLELTDAQKLAIWNYTQAGVTSLQTFRGEQGDHSDSQCSADVQDTPI